MGCSASDIQITPVEAPDDARFESGEVLVTTGDTEVPYEELAILTVGPHSGKWSTKKLLANFREAARRVGADAVVRVDFDAFGNGETGALTYSATGTAVRYQQ